MSKERKDLNNDGNEFEKKDENLNNEQNDSQENLNNQENENPENISEGKVDSEISALKELNENLEKEVADLKDRMLRKAAEFENYKRRTENEQMNLLKYAAEPFILKILTAYDDLQRSISHIKEDTSVETLKEGIQMVYNKFTKIFEDQGVKKINAKGEEFDFNLHEAVMQRNVEDVKPHTVIEEVEAGYMYKDKVIRHTKVIVSDDESGSKLK